MVSFVYAMVFVYEDRKNVSCAGKLSSACDWVSQKSFGVDLEGILRGFGGDLEGPCNVDSIVIFTVDHVINS